MSHKIRVAVLRGGPSAEHEVSLNTGANILAALQSDHLSHKYHPEDIVIDPHGQWIRQGRPTSIAEVARNSDVVWNGLHGTFGEDGELQQLLESHNIPFTGSDSFGSALGMNKRLAKKAFTDHDILTPYSWIIASEHVEEQPDRLDRELFRTVLLPVVVKPVGSGSSVGMSIVRTYKDLLPAIAAAAIHGHEVMLEEYIPGIEATCGVVEAFRGEEIYALPPVEIRPHPGKEFFDYEAKYQGKSDEIVPATFTHELKLKIQELAKKIHQSLGLRHYSRSDFIIHPRRGIFALEVNTLPGFTDQSLMPRSLRAIGSDTHEFVDHVIGLALN